MKFVQARNFTRVTRPARHIDVIVVHDMEYPERPTGAEWCANYFHNQRPHNPPRVNGSSAHYCIDNNSIVQSVKDKDVAWAAPGNNHNGIQLEHAGVAAQSRAQWLDAYSLAELKRSAKLAARLCAKYEIPVRRVRAVGLRDGLRGITGHADVSEAWHRSSHTDPGPNFPWVEYLRWVKDELDRLGGL